MAQEGAWPVSLRPIGKYLARANEIESEEPVVAYYCQLYSLKHAYKIRDKEDPNATKLLKSLLEKCEIGSKRIGSDTESHKQQVQRYALKVFKEADDVDRDGRATLETARTFYSAMCFLEVCRNFGPLSSDLEEKLKYAKWKVAEITKAMREGRRPEPGAPGEAEARAAEKAPGHESPPLAESPTSQRKPLYPPASGSPQQPLTSSQSTDASTHSHTSHGLGGDTQSHSDPVYPADKPEVKKSENDLSRLMGSETGYPANAPPYPSKEAPSPLGSYESPRLRPAAPQEHDNRFGYDGRPEPNVPQYNVHASGSEFRPPYFSPESIAKRDKMQRLPVVPERPVVPEGLVVPERPVVSERPIVPERPMALRVKKPVANHELTLAQISEAQKAAKNAISALDFRDGKTAVDELEKALAALTRPG